MDYQAAVAQTAGVGRYTRLLAEHLSTMCADDDLLDLFYFDFMRGGAAPIPEGARDRACRWLPGRIAQGLWKVADWPRFDSLAGQADLYHFTNFVIPPVRGGRNIATIHDLSFARHPEFAEQKNLDFLGARIADTVSRADAVITVSEFSAKEIRDVLGISADRVFATPLGVSESLRAAGPHAIDAMRQALQIDGPYLLCVGTLEPRKNHSFLISVFEALDDFDGTLVVAGMRGWKYEPVLQAMQDSPAADRIRYVEFVPEQHLSALYTAAEVFVFPSIYEGFGLPPLEALACGAPVLSSSAASLQEVLEGTAELMDGYDVDAWRERLSSMLGNSALREDLRKRGPAHAARFRWETTAKKTCQVYHQVLNA